MTGRLERLDAIRFFCAAWVALGHLGLPLYSWPPIIRRTIPLIFDGTWAVAAFFLISGFCIHFPYANGKTLNLPSFYVARFLRIGIPLVAAVAIACLLPGGMDKLSAVLWTLIASFFTMPPIRGSCTCRLALAPCVAWALYVFSRA